MNKHKYKINIKLLFFLIFPLLFQFILASIYNYNAIKDYNNFISSVKQNDRINPLLPLNSAFTYWIGGFNSNNIKSAFYYMIFLGAITPCLYFIPLKIKSNPNSKLSYGKSFFIGGLFSFLSLFFSFISILLFVPATAPDSVYDIYYDVIKGDTLCNVFYTAPVLYEIIYICLIFIFCGFICCLSYGCYKLLKNHFAAFFIPELFLVIIHIIDVRYSFQNRISPIMYCNVAVNTIRNIKQYFFEVGILLFCTMISYIINKKHTKLK